MSRLLFTERAARVLRALRSTSLMRTKTWHAALRAAGIEVRGRSENVTVRDVTSGAEFEYAAPYIFTSPAIIATLENRDRLVIIPPFFAGPDGPPPLVQMVEEGGAEVNSTACGRRLATFDGEPVISPILITMPESTELNLWAYAMPSAGSTLASGNYYWADQSGPWLSIDSDGTFADYVPDEGEDPQNFCVNRLVAAI